MSKQVYWCVSEDRKGPFAIVKTTETKMALMVAGSDKALKGFKDGQPNTFISEPWYFDPICSDPSWPELGRLISKLGPIQTVQTRLNKSKERAEKRKRKANLSNQDKDRIKQLRCNGVSMRKIAEIYQIGYSAVRNISINHPPST